MDLLRRLREEAIKATQRTRQPSRVAFQTRPTPQVRQAPQLSQQIRGVNTLPFLKQRQQIGQNVSNVMRQGINRVGNTRLENLPAPNLMAMSQARKQMGITEPYTPTIREQFKNTIATPLTTAFDKNKSPLDRGIGAVQGVFNSTPMGQAYQIGTGGLAGVLKSKRTGAPLTQSIRTGISNPNADIAMEGLGVENPVLAMGLNVLTGNPKSAIKGIGKLRNIKQAGLIGGKNATGYAKAANKFSAVFDKKPRFEIPDNLMKVKPGGLNKLNKGGLLKLEEVIDHKELFKQYPQLRKVLVDARKLYADTKGEFNGTRLTLDNKNLVNSKDLKQTILHEIQHAIQKKEGFARGGSPGQFKDVSKNAELKDLFNKQYEYVTSLDNSSPKLAEATEELNRLARLLDDPIDLYKRLGGEMEARAVGTRRIFTPAQRQAIDPYGGQGIKSQDVITKFDDGGVAGSIKPTVPKPVGGEVKRIENIIKRNGENFEDLNNGKAQGRNILTPQEEKIRNEFFDYTMKPEVYAKYEAGAKDPEIIQDFLNFKNNSHVANPLLSDIGNSEPLYHGTTRNFDNFDLSKAGSRNPADQGFAGRGIYLSNSKQVAETFAGGKDIYATVKPGGNGRIIETRLQPNAKVLEVNDFKELYNKLGVKPTQTFNLPASQKSQAKLQNATAIREKAQAMGYDAIKVDGGGTDKYGTKTYEMVVFDPKNIIKVGSNPFTEEGATSLVKSASKSIDGENSKVGGLTSTNTTNNHNSIISPSSPLPQGAGKVKLRPDQAIEKAVQTEKRIEQSLSPAQRTDLQLQEAQQSARLQGSSGGNSGSSPQKALDSSKYAYNINKNRVQLSPNQKETLDATVNAIKPELEKIKGKTLTNKEVVRAAKSSTMLQKVTTREETLAAEAATLKARQRLTELDKNIDTALRSGNIKQVESQMKELIESVKVVSSNASDAGRKLQSLSISAGDESVRTQMIKAITKTGADTEDILRAAKNVDWNNANSVTTFYRKFIKPTVPEILDEYRYNNMLSSLKTHERNAYSNVMQAYLTRPMTLVFEGRPVEASKYFTGAVKALPDAYDAFIKAFKGQSVIEKPDLERMIPTQKLPRFLTIPTRALEAGDRFFTTIIKQGELARGASKESAEAMAEYSLFRQGLMPEGQGPVLNAIDSFTGWTYKAPKAVRWFVPFIRTPMNFAKQWIEYSPAGISTIVGAGNKREQLAKAMIGSTVAMFGGMLAAQGRTTWATPVDPKEKELFYAAGRKPFSIQIGDKWVPMMYAGPFAMSLALPAAMKYYQEDSRTALSDNQVEKATQTVAAMAEFLSGQTFLGGIGNFVKWASGDVDYSLPKNLAFTAGQLVPMQGLVRYINTIVDPIYRKPKGFVESFQSGIPGLSQGLDPYTLPTGEESRRDPLNYVLPFDVGTINSEYEPLLQSRSSQLQQNAVENRAKKDLEVSGANSTVAGNKILYTDSTGSVKTIDLSPFDKVPTTALARAKQEQKKWDVAGDVYESTLPDEEKNNIINNLGLDPADVEYFDFASQDNDVKSMVIREELGAVSNREQLLQKLVEFRREVNGKIVLTSGVIDDLEDEGIISDAEAKQLKKIEFGKDGSPKVKVSGRGGGAKLKGVKISDVKNVMGVPKINTKIDRIDTQMFSPQFTQPDLDFKVPSLGVGGGGTIPQLPNFKIKFNL